MPESPNATANNGMPESPNATANNDDPSERRLEDLVARIAENTLNRRVNWKSVLATLHKSELPGDQSYWMRWSCDKLKEWCRKPRKPRKRDRKHRKRDRKHRKRDDHRKHSTMRYASPPAAAATAPVLGARERFRQLFKDNAVGLALHEEQRAEFKRKYKLADIEVKRKAAVLNEEQRAERKRKRKPVPSPAPALLVLEW